MVKGHLITDNQLRTAMDYQRSLGGGLGEVLVRLGFLREDVLKEFLAREDLAAPAKGSAPEEAQPPPPPAKNRARKEHPPELVPGVTEADPNRPRWPLHELQEGLSSGLPDSFLRELLKLLVRKGVISAAEEEEVLLAGTAPLETPAAG